MNTIVKCTEQDSLLISQIGRRSFIESHWQSAPATDIEKYVEAKYSEAAIKKEIKNPANIFHLVIHNGQPAGYSQISFDSPSPHIDQLNMTKLERLYLLQKFHGQKIGLELFHFILELAKQNKQAGIWLAVWTGNKHAIAFYERSGFKIIHEGKFRISDNHDNPYYEMVNQFGDLSGI